MNMKNYEGTWMCNPMDPPDERRWREFGKFGELKDAGAKCVLELNSKFNSGYDYGYYTPGIPNTLYASFREKDLIFNEDHTLFQIKDKEGTTLEWCSFLQTN